MNDRSMLHRYWFRFEPSVRTRQSGLALGAGVTGYTREDALEVLRKELAPRATPAITEVIEDVRFEQLDQGHVVPNMHPTTERGVWYPKLRAFG